MELANKTGLLISLVACVWGGGVWSSALSQQPDSDFQRFSRRAAPRDAFPVFHKPNLVPAGQVKNLRDQDWVIGVALKNEAKAYPIGVMGIHELGNDSCGGEPIAVSW